MIQSNLNCYFNVNFLINILYDSGSFLHVVTGNLCENSCETQVKIMLQTKFNWVNFKDLIGFIQWFINQVVFILAERKGLWGALQNEGPLQEERSRNK